MKQNWFVGIPIDLGEWLYDLEAPYSAKKFDLEDTHITVAFLGSLAERDSPAVVELIGEFAKKESKFEISFGGLIALPIEQTYTALTLEMSEGRDCTARIISEWREKFYDIAQCEPDTRTPKPHLTFARPLRRASQRERDDILKWFHQLRTPTTRFDCKTIALYTWNDERSSRQFKKVVEFQLTGGE